MNMTLTLAEEDIMEVQRILMDDDEKAALEFIKKRILERLPAKGSSPCDSTRINPFLMK